MDSFPQFSHALGSSTNQVLHNFANQQGFSKVALLPPGGVFPISHGSLRGSLLRCDSCDGCISCSDCSDCVSQFFEANG